MFRIFKVATTQRHPLAEVAAVRCHLPPFTHQVVTATVDLDEVVSFRAAISSLREQASSSSPPAMVSCDFQLCRAQGLTHPPVPPRVRGGAHVIRVTQDE
jgi:hypothetical protein